MTALDPVTLAVLNGRLVQIADEMDATLYRSAFNPIIAEAHDACHGIYHAETGATLVQGTSGLPIFVGAMAFAVKAVIDKVARDGGLERGDTYIFNDPYDGGTHLNDFRLVRPLMRNGEVFAWLASVGHWLDVGGNVPGNFNAKATESFQEGFRVPPVKLIRSGVFQQDVVDILSANSRVPQSNWGDLNGQLNALDLGERRLNALLDEHGEDTITAAMAQLSARAEALMRANIAALPDGTYSYDDFLDNDGVTDKPLRIALDLKIAGDRMVLDFSRSAPPCDGPLNISRSTTVACCYVALKHLFTDVPANAGCLAPIEFVIPDTTLLAVSAPKPVGGYTETILRVIDTIFGAFAKAAPERANGSPFATINALSLAGWREQGRRWVMFCFFGGGLGGNPEGDGLNHANNPISTATIPPVEILESLYPVMFTQWALRPDSGGPGRHRGGLGAIYEVEALADGGAEVFLLGERGKYPPFGVNGGKSAALNRFVHETDNGEATPPLVSKVTDVKIRQGQKVRLETPGGGGFGDPATRDPVRVARDVQFGYVSREAAMKNYKVALRDDGTLDADATAKAPQPTMNGRGVIVGVDVGGTFTDLFWLDSNNGTFRTAKVPSRRGDEALGFLNGLAALGGAAGMQSIVHGTTVGTNTLLERRGPKIGIIATRGFRDTLEMRRRDRRRTWGLWGDFVPIADRDMRLEVDERTLADGTIRAAVNPDEIRATAKALLANGAQAVAITFINAYANAENERRALEAVREVWPNDFVTASHEVLSEIREFERSSTAALNCYLQPVVASYLGKLDAALASQKFPGKLQIVQSNGGIMSTATARKFPARTALSGPAAGVVAGAAIARAAGHDNLITCDLGGTSFDVSVVAGGKIAVAAQTTVDFGLVIRTPMIEITTIGAGGGSIASVDRGGLLQVGPESAGSVPGPACYGAGNTRPTLTDAQVVLGRINAARPLGGELKSLDVEAAKCAIATHVGVPLKLGIDDAAAAIVRVAEARMSGAIRLVSIERGHDPSRFVAMPFGGGGALHAGALIREIGLKAALVPRFPGITSALGCVLADLRHDTVQTLNVMLDGLDSAALERRMQLAGGDAATVIAGADIPVERTDIVYELDMHYLGQTHTVPVPLPVTSGAGLGVNEAMIRQAFEAAYLTSFSRLLPGLPMRIVSLRVAAIGRRPAFDFRVFAPDPSASLDKAKRGTRRVWFAGGFCDTTIWSRLDLPQGARIEGPAILEQPDATTVIEPGLAGRIDALGNLIVEAQ